MIIETLFWISIFIVFYAHLGYGIFLKVLTLFAKDTHSNYLNQANDNKKVSLIIPCFNEEDIIENKIKNTLNLNYPENLLQVIFIADGSNDGTSSAIESSKPKHYLNLFEPERKGKAAAMNRAVSHATGEVLIFCDANTELNSEAIKNIVRHFNDPQVGSIAGKKSIAVQDKDGASSSGEGFYWKYESKLKELDSRLWTAVGTAGELMAFRADLYQPLERDTLLDDFMQSMRIAEKGYRIIYEPDAIATEYASENIEEELKRKIRIAAGGWQSMGRLKKAINPFHHFTLFFQYVSHRVLRWSLAVLLLPVIFVLNALLISQAFYLYLFIAQVGFYIAGLLGWLLQNKKLSIKILYIPYYFLMMNYAVFLGMIRHFKGSQSQLWERAKRKSQ